MDLDGLCLFFLRKLERFECVDSGLNEAQQLVERSGAVATLDELFGVMQNSCVEDFNDG